MPEAGSGGHGQWLRLMRGSGEAPEARQHAGQHSGHAQAQPRERGSTLHESGSNEIRLGVLTVAAPTHLGHHQLANLQPPVEVPPLLDRGAQIVLWCVRQWFVRQA